MFVQEAAARQRRASVHVVVPVDAIESTGSPGLDAASSPAPGAACSQGASDFTVGNRGKVGNTALRAIGWAARSGIEHSGGDVRPLNEKPATLLARLLQLRRTEAARRRHAPRRVLRSLSEHSVYGAEVASLGGRKSQYDAEWFQRGPARPASALPQR
ncbi:hypothetical protein OBBRIDRAFT_836939 [Obba rivulosa]|uniref:Uncharacterized protein n=1 Tax=Obba rivulosa TaxID=1052685 RepID=A0A8E2DJL6_9APHY|nr:hypothetical protein OBBRIDRAFT_836939 [Obba rivulosa]